MLESSFQLAQVVIRDRSGPPTCVQANKLFCPDWVAHNIGRWGDPTVQHLILVGAAVIAGFAIAFSMALLSHRFTWLSTPFLAGTGILYTVPSIAFFFLLLPITGLGRSTAIIALTAFTLQILFRNISNGLRNVPQNVREAGLGMGLTRRQLLWKVELPLALPEIIGGLRVATVSTVALATLAVFCNGGGLGTQIYEAGNLTFKTGIVTTGIIAMGMAIGFDMLLLGVQRLATPWRRVQQ